MLRLQSALCTLLLLACPSLAISQHVITMHKSKYSVMEDLEIGQEAAREVRQQLTLLKNPDMQKYVNQIGKRLTGVMPHVIPEEFMYPEFAYTFDIVDYDDIQAMALPGGPIFLYRGMIDEAPTEDAVAGIMAHEISHVALRHGTAGLTRANKFQWGILAGAIVGAVIGGTTGETVADLSRLGLQLFVMKYSREYEKDADLLGSQIMFKAGYDPRELATMFTLLEQHQAPQWLSSHPNPGNRAEYIRTEAHFLEVEQSRQ